MPADPVGGFQAGQTQRKCGAAERERHCSARPLLPATPTARAGPLPYRAGARRAAASVLVRGRSAFPPLKAATAAASRRVSASARERAGAAGHRAHHPAAAAGAPPLLVQGGAHGAPRRRGLPRRPPTLPLIPPPSAARAQHHLPPRTVDAQQNPAVLWPRPFAAFFLLPPLPPPTGVAPAAGFPPHLRERGAATSSGTTARRRGPACASCPDAAGQPLATVGAPARRPPCAYAARPQGANTPPPTPIPIKLSTQWRPQSPPRHMQPHFPLS